MNAGRLFIVGGTKREAVDWCKAHNEEPYARTTHIVTTPSAMHGHSIWHTDRVILGRRVSPELLEALAIARLVGGSA